MVTVTLCCDLTTFKYACLNTNPPTLVIQIFIHEHLHIPGVRRQPASLPKHNHILNKGSYYFQSTDEAQWGQTIFPKSQSGEVTVSEYDPRSFSLFQFQYSIFMITIMAVHCLLFSFKPRLTSPLTKFLSYWTERGRAYSLQVISLWTFHYSKTLVKCLYH